MKGFTGPLADRIAIRELVETYNDAVYRRDAGDWGDCWTEDARWDVGGRIVEGREALRTLWIGLMEGFAAVSMYAVGGALAVDGDEAEGRSYIVEMLKRPDGSEMLVSGRYDDRFRRDADGVWRFAERRYTVLQAR